MTRTPRAVRAVLLRIAPMAGVLFGLTLCGGGGCLSHVNDTRVSYLRGSDAPPLSEAPEAGLYVLYAADQVDLADPTVIYRGAILQQGDTYGFMRKHDGSVVGVARDVEIPLGWKAADIYYWKEQKGRTPASR